MKLENVAISCGFIGGSVIALLYVIYATVATDIPNNNIIVTALGIWCIVAIYIFLVGITTLSIADGIERRKRNRFL